MKQLCFMAAIVSFATACAQDLESARAAGGPVFGAKDAHCLLSDGGVEVQPTDPAACATVSPMSARYHPLHIPGDPYGDTLYGSEGDDDDCKYHVKWSSTAIHLDTDFTFTLAVTRKGTDDPATGAAPSVEAFLGDTHPAPNTPAQATERSPGIYDIGPLRFDASGTWTVRFHLYGFCAGTTAQSPHGHVAFYVSVP